VRRRHAIVFGIVVAAVLMAAVLLWPQGSQRAEATATTVVPTTVRPDRSPPAKHAFQAADATSAAVPVYAAPDDTTEPIVTLANPTFEGVPLTLFVKQHAPGGWLEVEYNRRPNGATGWIRGSYVALRGIDTRIVVGVAAKLLTVYKGTTDEVVFQGPVATGLPSTPTPLGDFYVDVVVKLLHPTGVYGPYQLSVAAFSDVLQSFGGGPGQIAIHGTNQPQLIGTDASNGCVRMSNEDVIQLASLAPPGTPVTIVA